MDLPISVARKLAQRLERGNCAASLFQFVRSGWHIVEPATPMSSNWHIVAICKHLEAVARSASPTPESSISIPLRRLLINIPPRSMKSLLVAVFFPAWVWTWWPSARFIFASYSQALSTRDSLKCRRVIESPWYKALWGSNFVLTSDQNQKMRFENSASGFRVATSVGGLGTGEGGDFVIFDDPHNVIDGESAVQRARVLAWWNEQMSTRLNDPKRGAFVGVMQRIHERDLSGDILDRGGYEHLMIPMSFEPDRKCETCIGFKDPRTEEGELFWPDRIGDAEVLQLGKQLGEYGVAGQLQQRPAPRGGGMFKVENFQIINALSPKLHTVVNSIRYWDKAGTDGGGCNTAGVRIDALADGTFVIVDCVAGQWSTTKRESMIHQTAEIDGKNTFVYVEQEPGSGGKESAEATIRRLAGFRVFADRVTGSKEVRAEPYAIQVEGGNVSLLRGEWNREFIDEHASFPMGKFMDRVDASAGAFNYAAKKKRKRVGTF